MKNSTVVINSTDVTFYRHGQVAIGYTQNNRTRFFATCKALLGNDYTQWEKHPNYGDVEKLVHTAVYNRPLLDYKANAGLLLQLRFLTEAYRQLSKKGNRQGCYEQVIASAIDAGIITAEQSLVWR